MKILQKSLIGLSLGVMLVALLCVGLIFKSEKTVDSSVVFADDDVTTYHWSYKTGDVNEDGKITSDDVDALKKLISNGSIDLYSMHPSKKTASMLAGDTNYDNWLNRIDVAILIAYLDGKIKLLPTFEAEWLGYDIPNEYKTKFGDVNRDGMINNLDLTRLTEAANKTISLDDYAFNNADVNKDRVIDEKDVEILDYYLQGKVKQLPCRYIKQESWLFLHHEEIGYDTFHTEKWEFRISLGNPVKSAADGLGQVGNALADVGSGIKKGCEDIYNGLCDFFGGLFK